jgi:hypothetical protein
MTEEKRKLIIAGDFHEFRHHVRENMINPRQALYVKDQFSLRGIVPKLVDIVWLPGAVAREDFNQIRAALVARGATDVPDPVIELDPPATAAPRAGAKFRIGGNIFTLTDVHTDPDGCQQWTLTRLGSHCERIAGQFPGYADPAQPADAPEARPEPDLWVQTRAQTPRSLITGDPGFKRDPHATEEIARDEKGMSGLDE